MPRKKPKKHQGAAQDERSALIFAAPGPHFTGAPISVPGQIIAKARAAQLTSFRSITAAAEGLVTFQVLLLLAESAPFGVFGLKCGSVERGIRELLRFCRAQCPHRVDPGRPGVPPLRNGLGRRVREAAPYMGWNLGDRWGWDPPLRRIWKRSLLFRRGRTLAGPPKGLCHSGAQPHPPRIRSAPSPKGKASGGSWTRPYSE